MTLYANVVTRSIFPAFAMQVPRDLDCSIRHRKLFFLRDKKEVKQFQLRSKMSFASETLWEFEKRFGRVKAAERFTEGGSDVRVLFLLIREIFVI